MVASNSITLDWCFHSIYGVHSWIFTKLFTSASCDKDEVVRFLGLEVKVTAAWPIVLKWVLFLQYLWCAVSLVCCDAFLQTYVASDED